MRAPEGSGKGKGNSVMGSRGNLMCPLSRGLRTFAFLPQTQNLKQQRSRREQFSRAPVSALPLAPNHLGKSQASQGALRVRPSDSGSEGVSLRQGLGRRAEGQGSC